jgi:hypothetical protein
MMKLAALIPWDHFERQLQPTYAPTTGASGITMRLMVSLHLFSKQLKQPRLIIGEQTWIKNVFVDMGCRGHKHQGPESGNIDQVRLGAIQKLVVATDEKACRY